MILGAIMARYNQILRQIADDELEPIFWALATMHSLQWIGLKDSYRQSYYARMRGKGYSSQNAAASFYFLSWPAELIPACVTAIAVLARKGSDANLDAAHG